MGAKRSKLFRAVWIPFGIIGLLSLFFILLLRRNSPQAMIRRALSRYGVGSETIKYWIAVSAFETAGWTSNVYKQTDNLFNLIIPGSLRLTTGEGQTIFNAPEDSAVALVVHVLEPFKYPDNFASLQELVVFMKNKGYFTSNATAYITGVTYWYNKLF